MNMSFQEKSVWISLITTLLVFGYYFVKVIEWMTGGEIYGPEIIGLFIVVVVAMIVIEAVSHIALALSSVKEAELYEDERDQLIELKATRNAYYLLASGVWVAAGSMLLSPSPLMMANVILFFFILSEITGFSSQLFYYRKGI